MVNRINTILQAKNITAKQFAEEIGVQPSGVSHILSGRNNPSLDFVMKVVRRYPEININWLMFGNGEMWVGNVVSSVMPKVETMPSGAGVAQFDSERKIDSAQGVMESAVDSRAEADRVGVGGVHVGGNAQQRNIINNVEEGRTVVAEPGAAMRNGNSANSTGHDNLTLFDDGEPNLFSAQNEKQDFDHSRAMEPVSNNERVDSSRVVADVAKVKTEEVSSPNVREGERAQLDENRSNDSVRPAALENPILAKKGRRIMKIVVLYDDHSFSEFTPER